MEMSEAEKLKVLLQHWIEHNREHSDEFRRWAEKAGDLGKTNALNEVMRAAQYMEKSSEALLKALDDLNTKKK